MSGLALGARLLLDRSDDEQEPLYVYADPQGILFASSWLRNWVRRVCWIAGNACVAWFPPTW